MKKVLFILLALSSFISINAQDFDGYKYVFLDSKTNNIYGVDDRIIAALYDYGFKIITKAEDISKNRNERLATLILTYDYELRHGAASTFRLHLKNMIGQTILESEGAGNTLSTKGDMNRGCKRALEKITNQSYSFNPELTPKLPTPETEKSNWTEEQIKQYLSQKDLNKIEGIYKNVGGDFFKLAILKDNGKYVAIVMDTDQRNWYQGDVKAVVEELKAKFYNISYYENDYKKVESIAELSEDGILKMGNNSYMKIYPME